MYDYIYTCMIIYVLYTSYEADAAKKAAVTIRIPRCPCYPVVVVIKHDWLESYRVTSTSRDWGFQAAPVFSTVGDFTDQNVAVPEIGMQLFNQQSLGLSNQK